MKDLQTSFQNEVNMIGFHEIRQKYDEREKLEGTKENLNGLKKKIQYDLATSRRRFDEEDYDEKEAEAQPASVMERSSNGDEDEQRSNCHPEMSFRQIRAAAGELPGTGGRRESSVPGKHWRQIVEDQVDG